MTDQLDLSLDRLRRAVDQATMPKPIHNSAIEDPAAATLSELDSARQGALQSRSVDDDADSSWASLLRRLFGR